MNHAHFAHRCLGLAALLPLTFLSGCDNPGSSPATTQSSASGSKLAAPSSAPSAGASASPSDSQAAHVFHYDLVLSIVEGSATKRASFSLDVSDLAPGSVSFSKNVSLAGGARADVGAKVKARLSMQGDAPRLEVDATLSSVDAAGKVHRVTSQGAALTPVGASVVVVDTTQDGKQYRLSATSSAGAALGAKAADGPNDAHVVDVAISHTGGGAPPKTTTLSLKLAGDAPTTANSSENVPLTITDGGAGTDGGGAVVRQDVGMRVKASGRPRGAGLDLDFDLELSALEGTGAAVPVRKIHAHGPLLAPFDKATTAFAAEEDGHRYEVMVTPRRVK